MSHTTDQLATTETQDVPDYDVSAPPLSYSYQDQQPPPYSEAPIIETTPPIQPVTKYESFRDIIPEAPSYPTPDIVSASFDDKAVRRGFVRKVCTILSFNLSLCILNMAINLLDICLVLKVKSILPVSVFYVILQQNFLACCMAPLTGLQQKFLD